MEKAKLKKRLQLLLKIVLTGVALFIVFQKVELSRIAAVMRYAHAIWFLPAFIFFNLSKIISALRLNVLFREIPIHLDNWKNLRLYYLGMFYNLFLPGGIGGDGYKVIYLKKRNNTSTKRIVQAVLMDRISGLVALIVLVLAFCGFILPHPYRYAALVLSVFVVPAFYLGSKILFPTFLKPFYQINLQSLLVQGCQVICALFILLALQTTSYYPEYLALFLVSSIITIVPVTVGGVGMRELVFVYAATVFPIDEEKAVTLGFVFFLITGVSSLAGAFAKIDK